MHACGSLSLLSILASLSSLTSTASAITLDCNKIVASGVKWDLSKLSGPRQVHSLHRVAGEPNLARNITYTIDLCRALPKQDKDGCPSGTRICAQQSLFHLDKDDQPEPDVEEVWPIAGEGTHSHGRALDPTPSRLKDAESGADAGREGLRISFSGGLHEAVDGIGDIKQKAYVELLCDRDWTGLEVGKGSKQDRLRRRDDKEKDDDRKDDDEEGDDKDDDDEDHGSEPRIPVADEGSALQFKSYNVTADKDGALGILRLEWRTKYACEDSVDIPDDEPGNGGSSSGFGFFGWFIILLFLGVAAYLIFGSYLNYSRYGARGWDLLPHGDAIRDVPYLLKDWARRVFGGRGAGSVGLGNRGGYSAV